MGIGVAIIIGVPIVKALLACGCMCCVFCCMGCLSKFFGIDLKDENARRNFREGLARR